MGDDLHRFTTVEGEDVILDLAGLIACWEGKKAGTIVFHLIGLDDPVEVAGDFEKFTHEWLDYYDCRQGKKKPRRKKQQGSTIVKIGTVSRKG